MRKILIKLINLVFFLVIYLVLILFKNLSQLIIYPNPLSCFIKIKYPEAVNPISEISTILINHR